MSISLPQHPYQEVLQRAEPYGGQAVHLNPPTLRWPKAGPAASYMVRYGRQADLSDAIVINGVPDTFYRPQQALAPGVYYWQYQVEGSPWSESMSFVIDAATPIWSVEDWSTVLSHVPLRHPRVFVHPDEGDALRAQMRVGGKAEVLSAWCHALAEQIGQPLQLEHDKPRIVTTDYNTRVLQIWDAVAAVKQTMLPAGELAFAYLTSGNEQFAQEAVRRAMVATRLDPDGYTSIKVSDFANGEIVKNAALAYDYTWHLLDASQKAAMREMLRQRIGAIYQRYRPNLEQRLFQAHAWQHIMTDFMIGALALYGEVPEAKEWFAWGLRMFVAFYPWWGNAEGGSAENPEYLTDMSLVYSQLNAVLIRKATSIDIMEHPWFKANPYFVIYSHPPKHWRSQLGDFRSEAKPDGRIAVPMLHYALRFQNPYAQAYAQAVGVKPTTGDTRLLYLLSDIDAAPAPRPLGELPKARAFRDCGMVFMHSDIDDPSNNIMFEFKSSPYGSFNHNHADQNCFNIIAFDEILLADTGYYIGYGDSHHFGWTITTAAHNCVLIDHKGQACQKLDAYGGITAFFTGSGCHYTVGSAAAAYHDVAVDRFHRHVLWIEPDMYIIYDQIDTPTPTSTQWLLHALEAMDIDAANRWVRVKKGQAAVSAYFAYPSVGSFRQTAEFAAPVPEKPVKGKPEDYPNQWHFTADSPEKIKEHRWLTVLFAHRSDEIAPPVERCQGPGWLGAQWCRQGVDYTVRFAADTGRVQMAFARIKAQACGLAAVINGDAARYMAISATEIVVDDLWTLLSDVPLIVEATQEEAHIDLRVQVPSTAKIRLSCTQPDGPLRHANAEWDWHNGYLELTLNAGDVRLSWNVAP
ncbi:MAG: DUF4962 domain-containing protein [Limnochordia bacterium]